MEKYNCIENGHVYGIWHDTKDGYAERTCEQCNFVCKVPIENEIRAQITKQEQAMLLWEAFGKVENQDQHLVDYLQVILEEAIPYFDRQTKDNLVQRMNEIKVSGYLSKENQVFFDYIMNIINEKKNNGNLYWEIVDEFQDYHRNSLSQLYEESTSQELKGHSH